MTVQTVKNHSPTLNLALKGKAGVQRTESFAGVLGTLSGGQCVAYKYRFFNCECGNVPALDVFVFCDDPSPFAFSSSSQLKVSAVFGGQ